MHPAMYPYRPLVAGILGLALSFGFVSLASANQPPPEAGGTPREESFSEVHNRAVAAFLKGRLDEALKDFNRAIKIDPTVALAYYNRGNVRLALKDATGAVADYTEAIKLRADFALAFMNRGSAYSNLWRLDEALADLNEAVRIEPKLADVFYNRAIVLLKRGENAKAMQDYAQVLRLDSPTTDQGAENRLKILQERQDGEVMPDDPTRITSELSHGRMTEFVLSLLERSCLAAGGDAKALAQVARKEGWTSVPRSRLAKENSSDFIINAWIFKFLQSAFYVVQSSVTQDEVVCSVSSMPVSGHLRDDFKQAITHRFEAKLEADITAPDESQTRYMLPGSVRGPTDLQIIHREKVRFMTLRTVHRGS